MKWSSRFSTGVPHLDRQHQMLFRMSEDYRDTLEEGQGKRVYGLMLESLAEYARAHFGMEEQCMYRYSCPVAEQNRDAHGQFLQALDDFTRRFESGGFDTADARQLLDYVDGWLLNHIGRIDVQLEPCVERGGQA